jgi:hypothetical protein
MSSELAFRAQLILREQRDVYDYWRRCARSKPMPSRSDIDPVAIPQLLPGLSLMEVRGGLDHLRYRLAGTRMRDIYGFDVTGRQIFELDLHNKYKYWRRVYSQVVFDGLPMQGAVKSPLAGRDHLVLIWLRLPLGSDERGVEQILGYDAALPLSSFAALDEIAS